VVATRRKEKGDSGLPSHIFVRSSALDQWRRARDVWAAREEEDVPSGPGLLLADVLGHQLVVEQMHHPMWDHQTYEVGWQYGYLLASYAWGQYRHPGLWYHRSLGPGQRLVVPDELLAEYRLGLERLATHFRTPPLGVVLVTATHPQTRGVVMKAFVFDDGRWYPMTVQFDTEE
jgi:hypothetical protein